MSNVLARAACHAVELTESHESDPSVWKHMMTRQNQLVVRTLGTKAFQIQQLLYMQFLITHDYQLLYVSVKTPRSFPSNLMYIRSPTHVQPINHLPAHDILVAVGVACKCVAPTYVHDHDLSGVARGSTYIQQDHETPPGPIASQVQPCPWSAFQRAPCRSAFELPEDLHLDLPHSHPSILRVYRPVRFVYVGFLR